MEVEEEIKIYKGKSYSTNLQKKYKKTPVVVAFDIDETLGSFSDLEILWNSILNKPDSPGFFFGLVDLYPEFIRYGIIPILEFLHNKKKKGIFDKLYIYTNNQCSVEWCKLIANYFSYKLDSDIELFDQIIYAFKINNEIVQIGRTAHNKKYNDFVRCSLLPPKTKICFVDNSYFCEMKNDMVYYIQPMSYFHNLSPGVIIDRYFNSPLSKDTAMFDTHYILYKNFLKKDRFNYYSIKDISIDVIVAQKMMYHIREFFYLIQNNIRTKKIKPLSGRVTRKRFR
jgi:hypothetical protein